MIAAAQLNQYRQACAEHARTPSAVAIRRDIYIGATSQQADTVKQHYLSKGYRGFSEDALMTGSVARFSQRHHNGNTIANVSMNAAAHRHPLVALVK